MLTMQIFIKLVNQLRCFHKNVLNDLWFGLVPKGVQKEKKNNKRK
jgi:hypothetical protein